MAVNRLVGLLYEAWKDVDRVVDGLDAEEAVQQFDGGSSYAWTYAHLGNSTDNWINVRFQKHALHEYISRDQFRYGAAGEADDWEAIRRGVQEVREAVRGFLDGVGDADLDKMTFLTRIPGSDEERSISLRYYVLRNCAHHCFHIGEIATKRDQRGQRVGDYPGLLEECL